MQVPCNSLQRSSLQLLLWPAQIDPSECRILLTDPPLNPSKNREKMVSHPGHGSQALRMRPRPSLAGC
jgi:hypothetical protein